MDRVIHEAPVDEHRPDPYAPIAALYDVEHATFDADIEMYRQFAYATGDPILELGCGTGRVLLPLAADGYRVTGLDSSTAMLARAQTAVKQTQLTDRVTLAEAEMSDCASAPGGPFGLAIIALNGLLHATTSQAQRHILSSVRQALDPRGQLILDVLNPTPEYVRSLEGTALEGTWTLDDGSKVMKFSHRRVRPSEQIIETDLWYDIIGRTGTLNRVTTSFAMRYLSPSELVLLLELAGYVEWELYGSYDLDPLDDASDRLIVTAEVSPSHCIA
jgi:SAM-dependent methyltransferase